jgi:hypothetical protein
MSGRESLEADDGERRNFHRFARAPPATRRHAGHISPTATSQVTASLHDFAVSLPRDQPGKYPNPYPVSQSVANCNLTTHGTEDSA